MSTSTDHLVALNATLQRRFYPRITPSVLIYVAFGPNNLGMLLNVSENGLLVSTPQGLALNSVHRVSLRLNGLPDAIKVHVRTVWTTASRTRSGIQLLDLSEHDREQIRKWGTLQLSPNEAWERWFPPENAEPSTATTEPPPALAASAEKPAPALVAPSPSFKDLHADKLRNDELPIPRNSLAYRKSTRSSKPALIARSAAVLAICLASAWPYRHSLSDRFLNRPAPHAKESAPIDRSSGHSPSLAPRNAPVTRAPSLIPAPGNAEPKTVAAVTVSKTPASNIPARKNLEVNAPAAKTNLIASPKPPTEAFETPEASDSDIAYSASDQFPTNDAVPATAPAATGATPGPRETRPSANVSATSVSTTDQSVTKILSSSAPPSRSAITGSISHSFGPSELPINTLSAGASIPARPPAFPPPSSARDTTYVERKSDPAVPRPNPAVIDMDVPEASVVELTPPRGRTASFVILPGERVLKSASVTMHIQRSVWVHGDRWLWHTRKKVALGELTSRIDPQISHLPTTSGTITVQATIDKDGFVTNLKPLNGSFAFLPSVARAIREWRYEPTYLDNQPVETQAQIEVNFHPPATRASRP